MHLRTRITTAAALAATAAAVLLSAGCGGSAAAGPSQQAVTDGAARSALREALAAAHRIGDERHLCSGCFPTVAADLTEDMNAATGLPFAVAVTPFGARMAGVVYLDTVGASRLTRTHITFYERTSNGTIWELSAGRSASRLFQNE